MKGPAHQDVASKTPCARKGPYCPAERVSIFPLSLLPTHFPGHFAAEDVKAKLSELNQKWESLKSKASQRRQDLEDSLQAQQYFADANEAESWMREKEPIVGSTDYGKDEDSAEVPGPGGPAGLGLAPVRKMTPVEGAASWLLPFELFRNLFSLSTVKIQSHLRREKTACPRFSLWLRLSGATRTPVRTDTGFVSRLF